MNQFSIAALFAVAFLFVPLASVGQQAPQRATPRLEMPLPRNNREWKQLRARAHSAPEFRALSKWCELQANMSARKQADREAELREYYAHDCCFNPVKQRPRRDELLNNQIQEHQSQARHWRELENLYSSKAKAMEEAVPQR
jgi:hypothetical protein